MRITFIHGVSSKGLFQEFFHVLAVITSNIFKHIRLLNNVNSKFYVLSQFLRVSEKELLTHYRVYHA